MSAPEVGGGESAETDGIGPRAMDVLPDGRVDHRNHDRDDQGGYGWVCLWCSTEETAMAWTIPYDKDGRPMPEDWRERPYREVWTLCGMGQGLGEWGPDLLSMTQAEREEWVRQNLTSRPEQGQRP